MADEVTTLLTPEVRAWLGRQHRFGPEPVIERDVLRYLVSTGAPLPGPGEHLRVPELYYRTLGRPMAEASRIQDDGLWPDIRPVVGIGQTLGGGIEVEFLGELRVGDEVHGVRELVSLEEKFGRRRQFVLATWRTTVWSDDGTELVRETVAEVMY